MGVHGIYVYWNNEFHIKDGLIGDLQQMMFFEDQNLEHFDRLFLGNRNFMA